MGKIKISFGMLAIIFYTTISCSTYAQEYVDKQVKQLNFKSAKQVFIIKNIFGNINVEGVNSTTGQLEIEEKIQANNKDDYSKAKEELSVKIEEKQDTILVYISAPYIQLKGQNEWIDYNMQDYNRDYSFKYNFTAKIPKDAIVIASTINDGDILINNINGELTAHNVNGSITIEKATKVNSVVTVNGSIDVDLIKNPTNNCRFKTINGDINVLSTSDLSADITYKSMNGEFFTNYSVTKVESEIIKEQKKKGKTSFYKLGNKPQFRIGDGKIKMSFETLNGNMIVKHK